MHPDAKALLDKLRHMLLMMATQDAATLKLSRTEWTALYDAFEAHWDESLRPEERLTTEHHQMQIGYLAAMVSMYNGREIPAIVAEVNEKIPPLPQKS